MKKVACFGYFIIFVTYTSFCQNIGIGTNSPAFKLDVNGRMRVKTGTLGNLSTSSGIWMDDYRDGTNRMFIGMQDSIRVGFYGSGSGGVGWGFNFNATTGNVGIGRLSSGSRLEVDDPTGGDMAFFKSGSFSGRVKATDTTLEVYSTYGSFNCIPDPCPSKDLIFLPPLNPVLGFPGNVGIGTSSPAEKLDINGTLRLNGEVNKVSTGLANMIPLAYGSAIFDPFGETELGGSTGNFTFEYVGTGICKITLTGESNVYANRNKYFILATATGGWTSAMMITAFIQPDNTISVRTFSPSSDVPYYNPADSGFNILIYKL